MTDDKIEAWLKRVEETRHSIIAIATGGICNGTDFEGNVSKLLALVRCYREANHWYALNFVKGITINKDNTSEFHDEGIGDKARAAEEKAMEIAGR